MVAGCFAAPGHLWTRQQAVKKPLVEILENDFQVVDTSPGRVDPLAAAHLSHQVSLGHDVVTGNIAAVARRVASFDRLTVHLSKQDVSDRPQHRFGGALKQIGKPHQQFAFAQSNGVVYVGKGEKFNGQFRDGRARAKVTYNFNLSSGSCAWSRS
jgi:hypothetical protein